MTFAERYDLIFEGLAEEGFRPKKWQETDIAFKVEGETLYICLDQEDEEYLQVLMLLGKVNHGEEYRCCMEITNKVNIETKVGKVFIVVEEEANENNVYSVAETFVGNWETWTQQHLLRYVSIIRLMGDKVSKEMSAAMKGQEAVQ